VIAPAGTGHLDVVSTHRGSVVRRAYATSPLRLLTPRNHGRAAWIYAGSYGGGLVGGDALRLTVHVGDGASAFLSTQASTKVYRSDVSTSVETTAHVGAGASLIIWPEPVVCFAGSTYRQQPHVDVASGGALVLVDGMTSGRRASGERWRFRQYASRATIRYDGRLVLFDSIRLDGEDGDLGARMGRFDVLCSATIVGPELRQSVDRIVTRVSELPAVRRAPLLVAAAPLSDVGCVLRIAGRSVEQIAAVLREHLAFVSPLLGDDPWARKW
jgi:urease accessory protein